MHPILQSIFAVFILLGGIAYSFIAPWFPTRFRHKKVKDQIVLITGGGSGFGNVMARKFAELGAIVVIWDISKPGLDGTVKQVKAIKGRIHSYVVDVSDREAVYATARKVQTEVGKVDILVNNAGIGDGELIVDIKDDYLDKIFKVNIISHFWITKAFLPAMISTGSGHIVTISSSAGLFGVPKLSSYCATKHAAIGFHESITAELKHAYPEANINTTVICPYFVRTGIIAGKEHLIPPSNKLFPIRDVEPVVDEFMDAILSNQNFLIPSYGIRVLNLIKSITPAAVMAKLRDGVIMMPIVPKDKKQKHK